jgi:hypothetical protein
LPLLTAAEDGDGNKLGGEGSEEEKPAESASFAAADVPFGISTSWCGRRSLYTLRIVVGEILAASAMSRSKSKFPARTANR